jgi:hypothetical protein
VLGNIRRIKTNKKNDNKNNEDIKDKEDNMDIGENTFLKLREEKLRLKEELDQVKIQRDISLRKQKKLEDVVKDLRKLVEHGQETK